MGIGKGGIKARGWEHTPAATGQATGGRSFPPQKLRLAALKIRNGNLLSEGTGEPLDDPTRGSSAAVPAPGGMTCHGPDVCWEAPLPLPI